MLSERAAVFRIAPDRHEREAKALLGEGFAGIACSDRWWAYDYLEPEHRQLCWAHLVRDFTAHSEAFAAQREFGQAGLAITARIFEAWQDFKRDGNRRRLLEQISPLKAELKTLLEQAARKSTKTKRHRLFAKNLLKRWPALWTFTLTDGVEPTNNHAERGLRGAVIHRKLSLGSQSEQGERIIERLLSASVTCRLQGRSLFAYLTDALNASIRGDPIPTLAWPRGVPERLPKPCDLQGFPRLRSGWIPGLCITGASRTACCSLGADLLSSGRQDRIGSTRQLINPIWYP